MDLRRSVQVGARKTHAIPMHYNTWPPIEVDVNRFAPEGVEVIVMEPGDAIELSPETDE